MRRIYYTGVDQGDGSLGVEFFDTDCIAKLEVNDPECYRGEGGGWFDISDDATIEGLLITTEEEVNERLSETTE